MSEMPEVHYRPVMYSHRARRIRDFSQSDPRPRARERGDRASDTVRHVMPW